jgi:RimJ/RimL family protein N-acetyltransferase
MIGMSGSQDVAEARLRAAEVTDAAALLALKARLDRETQFMLLEPGERESTPERQAEHLAEVRRSPNSIVIVAEIGDEMAGYVELVGGRFHRDRATSHVIIGILAQASGQGLGTRLMQEAERYAAGHGVHRLELNVMAHNSRAIALYERMGFAVEGRRRDCLWVNGRFRDELYMSKLLPGPAGDPGRTA